MMVFQTMYMMYLNAGISIAMSWRLEDRLGGCGCIPSYPKLSYREPRHIRAVSKTTFDRDRPCRFFSAVGFRGTLGLSRKRTWDIYQFDGHMTAMLIDKMRINRGMLR